MIRDRGKMKWQGFFMPEHTRELRKVWKDGEKQPRPYLSEDQIEEMEKKIQESFDQQISMEITLWNDGYFTKRIGTVKQIDPINRKLTFVDELDSDFTINFYNITNIVSV